jgi:prepilin-type N-terminal cleavage/methylation domain-containing protein
MKKSGFTLVELSIVLVIIGLIVGGVVGGQSLIASARINAQVTQLTQFETAYRAFQLQYDAIPGDMIDASDYWPGATNGDGNNRLTEDADGAHSVARENIKFFEHLSRAGVIPEIYTNVWALGQGYPVLEIDKGKGMVAAGNVRSSGSSEALHQISEESALFQYKALLALNVSQPSASGSAYNDGEGVVTTREAKNIDTKIDDGRASTGKFWSHTVGATNCLDGIDGDYLLSNTQDACMGAYVLE